MNGRMKHNMTWYVHTSCSSNLRGKNTGEKYIGLMYVRTFSSSKTGLDFSFPMTIQKKIIYEKTICCIVYEDICICRCVCGRVCVCACIFTGLDFARIL